MMGQPSIGTGFVGFDNGPGRWEGAQDVGVRLHEEAARLNEPPPPAVCPRMKAILLGALVAVGLAASPVARADEPWREDARDEVRGPYSPEYRGRDDGRFAPSPRHFWVRGYWARFHHRWVWIPGHWQVRGPGYGWDDGYGHRHGRYPWRPGGWYRG